MNYYLRIDNILNGIINTLECGHSDAEGIFEAYEMTHEINWDMFDCEIINLICED